jgi:hypothetical protein
MSSNHRAFAHSLLTQVIFIVLAAFFVLSQILFNWSCPIWCSFFAGAVIILPISSFISFRIMLYREQKMGLRRHSD